MIFDVNGGAFLRGIEAGSLGDRPAFEGAVHLKGTSNNDEFFVGPIAGAARL
jgi:hypothetical protein